LRAWGDASTRLDRVEPELNFVPDGEQRDTTTPRAMARTVARLFSADGLGVDARSQLKQWMIDTRTGLNRTRAYAMGLGQIYFNLRGRESGGIVSPGAEAARLADEISARLLAMADPDDRSPIVRAVYQRDEVYAGPYVGQAAELQIGMHEGYRVSWQTTLGGAPDGLVYPNMQKWSADHGGYDFATTAGVLVTNRRIASDTPSIMDIAPTVLKYFGLQVPSDLDGRALFD
jgi:predicted AlkP superfamily phosphohydrolase/phosphomutase